MRLVFLPDSMSSSNFFNFCVNSNRHDNCNLILLCFLYTYLFQLSQFLSCAALLFPSLRAPHLSMRYQLPFCCRTNRTLLSNSYCACSCVYAVHRTSSSLGQLATMATKRVLQPCRRSYYLCTCTLCMGKRYLAYSTTRVHLSTYGSMQDHQEANSKGKANHRQ